MKSGVLLCVIFISILGTLKSELYNAKNFSGVIQPKLYNSTKHATRVGTNNCTRPFSKHWTIDNFPNPQMYSDIDYCGRGCKSSWICDPDHIIKPEEADEFDKTIGEFRQIPICNCSNCVEGRDFYSVSILILDQLNLLKNDTAPDTRQQIAVFADQLIEKWALSSCGSNVVIILSTSNSLIRASLGPTVRSFMYEFCINTIHDEALKILAYENPALALDYMVRRFRGIFEYSQCYPPIPPPASEGLPSEALIGGIGVFVVLLGYGGYMIKQDLAKKARLTEDKLKKSSKSRKKRKPSLALINARRKSLKKNEEALQLKENDANINIIITNEDGIDIKKSGENNIEFR